MVRVSARGVDWKRSLSPPPPLSNADKVLYPRDGICKRDIVGYYRDVAPVLLPHLLDRPVVIQRWPDGIDEFDWYQHRVPPRAPDYLRAAWVDGVRRIVIENTDALLWMVNQAGLTYHGFASRLASLAEPDYAMIDLDPGDETTWADLVEIALAVRRVLELLELPSVRQDERPARPPHPRAARAGSHVRAGRGARPRHRASCSLRLLPDQDHRSSTRRRLRGGKLLVDHKQFVAKTLVVPYSLRAADGAHGLDAARVGRADADARSAKRSRCARCARGSTRRATSRRRCSAAASSSSKALAQLRGSDLAIAVGLRRSG